jgi:drug/metabolite transporter (DMT)-like permease
VAALFVWLFVREARVAWTWRAWVVGVAYAATVTLFVLGNKLTTSANTIFLQSTAPLYIVLAGPWLLGERIRARDLLVMLVVAAGMTLFFVGLEPPVRTAPDPLRGNLVAAGSGLAWAFTVIGLRWMGRTRPPARGGAPQSANPAAQAVVSGNLIAFLTSLPLALPLGPSRPLDWGIIAALGIVQIGVAYMFLTAAMRVIPAFEASLLLLLEPILNPIWAWIIHGEAPRALSLLGGAIILAATLTKTWRDARAPEASAAS